MSFLGFGPTELRLVLMAGAIRATQDAWVQPFGAGIHVRLFDIGGVDRRVWAGGGVHRARPYRNTRALYLAEPIPARTSSNEGGMTTRVSAFFAIGVAGFVLQIVMLHWLSSGLAWPYVPATSSPWNRRSSTTSSGTSAGPGLTGARTRESTGRRLLRFHLGAGMTSLVGNVVVTAPGIGVSAPAEPDSQQPSRWWPRAWRTFSFRTDGCSAAPPRACAQGVAARTGRRISATASAETMTAVEAATSRLSSRLPVEHACRIHVAKRPEGRSIRVAGGTIHEWRGAVLVRGVTVSAPGRRAGNAWTAAAVR
jgi:hypothetical protein